jgi:TatA/E family protein of Tat protein translocase
MFNMNPFEMVVIGIIALLVVGPKGLPDLGRMVGRWMKTFREAADEMKRGLYFDDDYRPSTPPRRIAEYTPPEPPKAEAPPAPVQETPAEASDNKSPAHSGVESEAPKPEEPALSPGAPSHSTYGND